MREKEACLKKLTSYHFKTLLLRENQRRLLAWTADDLLVRVMGILDSLVEALENNNLPNHFIPEMNLIKDLKPVTVTNIKRRVMKLISNEKKFRKFIRRAK